MEKNKEIKKKERKKYTIRQRGGFKQKPVSATSFYKYIRKEEDKYKLVNDLFIVKYLDNEVCSLVGDFLRAGNYAGKNRNLVRSSNHVQLFNKKENLCTSSLYFWKPLDIQFKEEDIKEILDEDLKKVKRVKNEKR